MRWKEIECIIFILLILNIGVISAYSGKLNLLDENGDSFIGKDLSLKIGFSNNEEINVITDSSGEYEIDSSKIFCWNNCNLVNFVSGKYIQVEGDKNIEYKTSNYVDRYPDYFENVFVELYSKKYNKDFNKKPDKFFKIKGYHGFFNGSIYLNDFKKNDNFQFSLNAHSIKIKTFERELNFNSSEHKNSEFLFNLSEEEIKKGFIIDYFYLTDDDNPNLKIFDYQKNDFRKLSKDKIIFYDFFIKKVSENKVEEDFNAESGITEPPLEDFLSSFSCVVYATPIFSRNEFPVLLIHGLHGDDIYYWGMIPDRFNDQGFWVYGLIYSPSNSDSRYNSFLLKKCIELVKEHGSFSKVNLVAHSMGGLVAFSYLDNLSRNSEGSKVYYENDVNKVVTIGSPLHGVYSANRLYEGDLAFRELFRMTLHGEYFNESFKEEAYRDLSIGSTLTWNINDRGLKEGVKYLTVAGISNDIIGFNMINFESLLSDSLVSVTSVSLLQNCVPLVLLRLNHFNLQGVSSYVGPYTYCNMNENSDCNINNMATGISSFLKDDDEESIKNNFNLSTQEYYISCNTSVSDEVFFHESMILLRFLDENPCSDCVKLKNNIGEFYLFQNPETKVFSYYSGNNNYLGVDIPNGEYELYVDEVYTQKNITLKPLRTNIFEINLIECKENWSCSIWGECINGTQQRECNDLNRCGTNNCVPYLNQSCYENNLELKINSPISKIYSSTKILINISLNKIIERIELTDSYKGTSSNKVLCSNCSHYKNYENFKEGNHSVTIEAIDLDDGGSVVSSVNFLVDTRKPIITKVYPEKGFSNGNFHIEFVEENPKSISLNFGNLNKGIKVLTKSFDSNLGDNNINCFEEDKITICDFSLNINEFDEENIDYSFSLQDSYGNFINSKKYQLKVDNMPPIIENISSSYSIKKNYAYFKMKIIDKNFETLSYIDYSSDNPKWKNLCVKLKNGYCEKKVLFFPGEHRLKIMARDKAGNFAEEDLLVNV